MLAGFRSGVARAAPSNSGTKAALPRRVVCLDNDCGLLKSDGRDVNQTGRPGILDQVRVLLPGVLDEVGGHVRLDALVLLRVARRHGRPKACLVVTLDRLLGVVLARGAHGRLGVDQYKRVVLQLEDVFGLRRMALQMFKNKYYDNTRKNNKNNTIWDDNIDDLSINVAPTASIARKVLRVVFRVLIFQRRDICQRPRP